jgi:hypothetical protein
MYEAWCQCSRCIELCWMTSGQQQYALRTASAVLSALVSRMSLLDVWCCCLQCFTQPGYGRKSVRLANGQVTYVGALCPIGTYNIGGNTAGCQSCNPGLTTADMGSVASTDCVAPAGSYLDKLTGRKVRLRTAAAANASSKTEWYCLWSCQGEIACHCFTSPPPS